MSPRPRGSRTAFFGGSFDPPHLGHLAVARAARAALGLDTVLFAPVGAQPLKPVGSTASFDDRVAMTRLAIAGEPGFQISLADAPKPSGVPNYTLETLQNLRKELPPECTLYCLMGADSFVGLQRWHRAAEIPFVAPLIVASRPGQPLEDLKALLPPGLTMEPATASDIAGVNVDGSDAAVRCYSLLSTTGNWAGQRTPFYLLPGLDVEISASWIRAQARALAQEAEGSYLAGHELLPDAVSEYLQLRGLYR
ncbi:MAG TPA: nicotinate (nicotinamide) nucleotide adenylyltransferase [Terracidiphilus sp.]|nr:nicotinate (nicotinamide) nucleotide adenylyltransferase [Terracidiphilus sp.]